MIRPTTFVLVCVAGGSGATLWFLLDGLIRGAVRIAYPIGTTLINVSGSLALSVLTGSAMNAGVPNDLLWILGGGLMGGYTTFSTASLETFRLAHEHRFVAATANGAGMLLVSVAAALVVLTIGRPG
jgi:CrcB protein